MKEVCTELEKESDADSDDQKKARFDAVLHLMQKVRRHFFSLTKIFAF